MEFPKLSCKIWQNSLWKTVGHSDYLLQALSNGLANGIFHTVVHQLKRFQVWTELKNLANAIFLDCFMQLAEYL